MDNLRTIWQKRIAVHCEGYYQSAVVIEKIFTHYNRFTGSREFYRMLIDILDDHIEKMAVFNENLTVNGHFPHNNKFLENSLSRAQEKSWQVCEDICNYVKNNFNEDWWDRAKIPKIP